jgi:CheY-like chemotaxis protein
MEPHPRVLVVEDDESIRSMLSVLLEQGERFALELAADGAEALRRAREHPPEVVVVDLRLPRVDGFEVARQLRADPRTRRAWIVAISADHARAEAVAAGCDEFFLKPLDIAELEASVRRGLERAGREPLPLAS